MSALNDLAIEINANAVAHGFWEADRNFGEMIALMHSELSEALEEHRAGKPAEYFSHGHCPVGHAWPDGSGWESGLKEGGGITTSRAIKETCKPEGTAVELADCLIRILDTMHSLGVDIDGVVARKMAYNAARPYKHGKAY